MAHEISPFENDKSVHCPWQVEESLVSSDCINSPLGNYFRFEGWKELGKPGKKKKWQFEIKWCCFWDTLGKFWLYFLSTSSFICATAVHNKCQSAAEFEIMLPYFISPNCTFWIFDIPNNYYKTVWKVWCNHTPRMYIQCQICEATQHHLKKKV